MKIKQLLQIQKIVEGRAIPYDVLEAIEENTYFSKSKEENINIGDMHLTHLLRVFIINKNYIYEQFNKIIKKHNESVEDGTYWKIKKELDDVKKN